MPLKWLLPLSSQSRVAADTEMFRPRIIKP